MIPTYTTDKYFGNDPHVVLAHIVLNPVHIDPVLNQSHPPDLNNLRSAFFKPWNLFFWLVKTNPMHHSLLILDVNSTFYVA